MSYEEEIAELWKEWKKSTEKYEEANEDGYDVDAEMWANDVETIHRQIHLYEQAAKADEYEGKAKAFDRIVNQRNQAGTDMYGKEDDVVDSVIESAFWNIDGIIVEYESGESDGT